MRTGAAIVLAAFAALTPFYEMVHAETASSPLSINVEGSVFHITRADGRVISQSQLVGAVISLGDGSGARRRIKIESVTPDPRDRDGDVILYGLSEQDGTGEWKNICEPDPDGLRLGFPLQGAFTQDMRHVDMAGHILITCTGGAEGKCIRFGYKPWRQDSKGNSLAPFYQACVRMVRADYCGDGIGHTRNGTPIDIFDRIGIQKDEVAPGMSLEAAWGPEGAVCVRHSRLAEGPSMDALRAACPRLAEHVGTSCDESVPALIYNRSYGQ